MKRLFIIAILFGAMPFVKESKAAPQDNVRKETLVRTDTITYVDTIITTKKVRRTEFVERYEEVFYSDSVVNSIPVKVVKKSRKNVTVPVFPSSSVVTSSPEEIILQEAEYVDSEPLAADSISSVSTNVLVEEALPNIPGGNYLWIPDSLAGDVATLLRGGFPRAAVVRDSIKVPEKLDENEMVTFRGDTIRMVLRDRNLGRYDRGLLNYLFIPKGIWTIGLTASYGEFSTKDLEVLDLLSDIDFSGHIFSIRPYFSYFINNNRSVGMRLGYTSGKASIGSFKVDIDEDMNFNLHDISYRSENYTAAITYNQYFGIARRGRFGIYNEVELAFSSGNSDFIRPYAGELKTTHTNSMEVALNFSPGLCVYIMDPVSFNISFGVFGITLRNYKQTVDGVDMGNRFTSAANFRFNIFNISFGIAVNF